MHSDNYEARHIHPAHAGSPNYQLFPDYNHEPATFRRSSIAILAQNTVCIPTLTCKHHAMHCDLCGTCRPTQSLTPIPRVARAREHAQVHNETINRITTRWLLTRHQDAHPAASVETREHTKNKRRYQEEYLPPCICALMSLSGTDKICVGLARRWREAQFGFVHDFNKKVCDRWKENIGQAKICATVFGLLQKFSAHCRRHKINHTSFV